MPHGPEPAAPWILSAPTATDFQNFPQELPEPVHLSRLIVELPARQTSLVRDADDSAEVTHGPYPPTENACETEKNFSHP